LDDLEDLEAEAASLSAAFLAALDDGEPATLSAAPPVATRTGGEPASGFL